MRQFLIPLVLAGASLFVPDDALAAEWFPPSTELVSSFDAPPHLSPLGNSYWYLREDLRLILEKKCTRLDGKEPLCAPCTEQSQCARQRAALPTMVSVEITVPKGFVTDLASIPAPLRLVFKKTGRYSPAGIVHDFLYWEQPCGADRISRRIADQIIKEALKASDDNEEAVMFETGTPLPVVYQARRFLSRQSIKYGVIVGGGFAWRDNRKKRAAGERRYLRSEAELEQTLGSQWEKKLVGMRWEHAQSRYGRQGSGRRVVASSNLGAADGAQRPIRRGPAAVERHGYCRAFFEKKARGSYRYLETDADPSPSAPSNLTTVELSPSELDMSEEAQARSSTGSSGTR